MSSTQQYKDYNKRLKQTIKELKEDVEQLKELNHNDIVLIKRLQEDRFKLERQLKQSKKWYQIILK